MERRKRRAEAERAPRAACSGPQGRLKSRTSAPVPRLQGKERSIPGPPGCVRPDIPPRRAAAGIAPGHEMRGPDYYRAKLARFRLLSHLTIQVEQSNIRSA